MLDAAREHDRNSRVEWVQASAETWNPATLGAPIDVLVSNAALQWVPGHLELFPRWFAALAPGGWFAMQVPNNFNARGFWIKGDLGRTISFQTTFYENQGILPRYLYLYSQTTGVVPGQGRIKAFNEMGS